MPSIIFDDVTFSYPVFDLTGRSVKVSLMKRFGGNRMGGVAYVTALSQVSLEISEGDRVGLIGRNGAGKSTMLRLMAGLLHPTHGKVKIEGRLVPLIAKGLGLHPELSGYENIELPMRLLGAKSTEIHAAKKEIPQWTDLGEFIHLPLRTYSDGMRARLLFAICTAVRGDVLVMDEWLSAGDADFVSKAEQRLRDMVSDAGVVVLSSHSMDLIRSLCNVVVWMEEGRVVLVGDADTVIRAYLIGMQKPPSATAAAA
ncbi:MAG: ABC transporter ATP-binding protein [Caulobacterales bacterium]